jgi:tetratricopeptide (TPR) repeat protein
VTTPSEIRRSTEEGQAAYAAGRYSAAVDRFRSAAQAYAALGDQLNCAEQQNNLSVALLKLGLAKEALDAALGTDEIFARAHDARRQGMAVNNQGAALDTLGRSDEALAAYERAAAFLAEAGEGELRALVLKAAASIELRRGKLADSGLRMIGALEARQKPSIFERLLRFLLRIVQR